MSENVVQPAEFERLRKARENPASGVYRDAYGRDLEPLDFLRLQLRVDVVGVEKVARSHDLVLRDGSRIKLGTAADLLEPRKLRAALYDHQVVIPRYKGSEVDEIARAIAEVVEVMDVGSDEDTTRAWLEDYARERIVGSLDLDDPGTFENLRRNTWGGRSIGLPEVYRGVDDCLYLRIHPFVAYVTRAYARTTFDDMKARLRRLDFEPDRVDKRIPGTSERLRARVWRSPRGFDPFDEG